MIMYLRACAQFLKNQATFLSESGDFLFLPIQKKMSTYGTALQTPVNCACFHGMYKAVRHLVSSNRFSNAFLNEQIG